MAHDLLPVIEHETEDVPFRHRDYKARGHRKDAMRAWDARKFIAFDGEGLNVDPPVELSANDGEYKTFFNPDDPSPILFDDHEYKPQPYVLLANSEKERIIANDPEVGLSTWECFEFLLNSKKRHPNTIFVGFGFNYDVNQILKDLSEKHLSNLHKKNKTHVSGYFVRWLPRKMLTISHRMTKRSVTIYDVFGFFQASFLKVCEAYLGEDHPYLQEIATGKEHRGEFKWEELDDLIIPYNDKELSMLVEIMDLLRKDLHAVGIDPSQWHGPGAVANEVLAKHNVVIPTVPTEVLDAAQYAYAGGRFEDFYLGRFSDTVYEYDISSAYPAAATRLPDLSQGTWDYVTNYEPGTFGVWHVDYRSPYGDTDIRPQPLFCRAKDGSVSYPPQVSGWYWSPEANLVSDYVSEGYVFRPATSVRPFAFIEDYYAQRQLYQQEGNSAERAIKLILNSIYGKLAQTIGGKNGKPPRWHCLPWAGYITSWTRAKIYEAMMQAPESIIATETDAVFSTVPLTLPISILLGDWKLKEYKEIVYIQSGFYYATTAEGKIVCKYRGMDRDRETGQPIGLPYREVLDHLDRGTGKTDRRTPSLVSYTTRYIGIGIALNSKSVWRSWEKKPHVIALDQQRGNSKRVHVVWYCHLCQDHKSMYETMHPMSINGYQGHSHARIIPWRKVIGCSACDIGIDESLSGDDSEFTEMDGAFVLSGERMEAFQ